MYNITEVDIAGKGVGQRLHKPILDESGIANKFVRVPDGVTADLSFEKTSAQMIIIGTPTHKHIQHIKYAVDFYKVVLCEKPVGNSLDAINDLFSSIGKRADDVFVDYQLRFLDIATHIHSFIDVCKPKSVNIDYCSGARMSSGLPDWYVDYKRGGGVLYSLYSHIIDFLFFVGLNVNNVKDIRLRKNTNMGSIPLDKLTVLLTTTDAVSVFISIDTKSSFDKFTFTIKNENDSVDFDFISDSKIVTADESQYPSGTLSSRNPIPWRLGFKRLISTLCKNGTSIKNVATLSDAIRVHETIDNTLAQLR